MSHRLSHTGSFVVMMAALSMFVSCGIPTMKQASMTRTEAIARVKQLAQDTARAIAPGVPTTVHRGDPTVGGCTGDFGDKVSVAYDLMLPELPAQRSQQILVAAKAYFERKGYRIDAFHPIGDSPIVIAETPDGFNIDYIIASDGTSVVGAGSPCVSPK